MDLPLPLQTAYQELQHLHSVIPTPSIEGSILKRSKGENHCWVARKRAGKNVLETAIGPDTEEVRARIEKAGKEQAALKLWKRSASACVATLQAGRCLAPDMTTGKLLAAIAKTGFFTAGGMPRSKSVPMPGQVSTLSKTSSGLPHPDANLVRVSGSTERQARRHERAARMKECHQHCRQGLVRSPTRRARRPPGQVCRAHRHARRWRAPSCFRTLLAIGPAA
ncbi:hypothetical protein [Rhodobacter sp. NSM]|uniref:hypothetical protein n=1 Tax=Rhodobacter sp. NSM TaxID=3457501 RepID=UPI003FD30EAD